MPHITTSLSLALIDLLAGKPVAIPTETVYGLAAMIDNEQAIQRVFAMKNRPLNHPLIVHVAENWDLHELVEEIPDYAKQLIQHFWPGPLTLVFRRKEVAVSSLITGGQPTVAIRCPAHALTQKLLKKLQTPLVAPSANPFSKISPTTALHVERSFPDQDLMILDGGRCSIGIESTIIDVTDSKNYRLLRHGLIDEKAVASVIDTYCSTQVSTIRVPGKMDTHYQPQKILYYFEQLSTLLRFCEKKSGDVYVMASQQPPHVDSLHFHLLAKLPEQAAFDLYFQLRLADESKASCIAIELPPEMGEWQGIRERILKAGQPYSV